MKYRITPMIVKQFFVMFHYHSYINAVANSNWHLSLIGRCSVRNLTIEFKTTPVNVIDLLTHIHSDLYPDNVGKQKIHDDINGISLNGTVDCREWYGSR